MVLFLRWSFSSAALMAWLAGASGGASPPQTLPMIVWSKLKPVKTAKQYNIIALRNATANFCFGARFIDTDDSLP